MSDTAGIINSAGGFINLAGAWGLNEFLVFLVLLFVLVVALMFYFAQKSSNKTTDTIIDIQKDFVNAINRNTFDMQASVNAQKDSTNALTMLLDKTIVKHDETHDYAKQNGYKIDTLSVKVDEIGARMKVVETSVEDIKRGR